MITISKEDLSDEEFEAIVSSRGFQKMLLYQRLEKGIEALRTHDLLYESMVQSITDQHSEVDSSETVQEVLSLLEQEVAKYTEPLADQDDDGPELADQSDESVLELDVAVHDSAYEEGGAEQILIDHLEERLAETDQLELKANELAPEIGLSSTHIGGILGNWRHDDDPPFSISATESAASGNLWRIQPRNPDSPEGDSGNSSSAVEGE